MRIDSRTAVDLFSGCGGLTLGLKSAGFRVLAGVEIDAKAAATYRANHPEVVLFERDIDGLEPDEFMRVVGLNRGELDLLAACPPCQGFSRIRTRNGAAFGHDPRNELALRFVAFAVSLKPKHLLLENVPGLLNQRVWRDMLKGLEAAGYHLNYRVVDAADYGVPQRRKRLILLGSRIARPEIPGPVPVRTTVRAAFEQITDEMEDDLHKLRPSHSPAVLSIIRSVPPDGGSRRDIPEYLRLPCHKKTDGFGDVYGRMRWDDVSPTITSGCINPSKGRFIHPQEHRAITLREAALLQGFPVSYRFDVELGKESLALMIGNALPPVMIQAHAEALVALSPA